MSDILGRLSEELASSGYETAYASPAQVLVLNEDGEASAVFELIEGWLHARQFIGPDFGSSELVRSMLLMNDRLLGLGSPWMTKATARRSSNNLSNLIP